MIRNRDTQTNHSTRGASITPLAAPATQANFPTAQLSYSPVQPTVSTPIQQVSSNIVDGLPIQLS